MMNQKGRSMIEMLGVLAIIGVLSVGGLEGYSKAMFKYKINILNDQLNTVLSTLIRYKQDLKINDKPIDTYPLIPMLRTFKELPENMFKNGDNTFVYDIFGNSYRIYHHNTGYIGILIHVVNSHKEGVEICRNFILAAKNYSSYLNVLLWSKKEIRIWGDNFCSSGNACLKNLTLNEIDNYCTKDLENQSSDSFNFYYILW